MSLERPVAMQRFPVDRSSLSPMVREAPGLRWLGGAGDLPDINIWLALAVEEHPHHHAAKDYWNDCQERAGKAARKLWFCRTTMLGFVRLLAQPKVMGPGALSLAKAYGLYWQWLDHEQIDLLVEPNTCDAHLTALLAATTYAPRLWTDLYLGAVSEASGLRLVSFDTDFAKMGLSNCLVLANPN
jgi:uncharacterized protein